MTARKSTSKKAPAKKATTKKAGAKKATSAKSAKAAPKTATKKKSGAKAAPKRSVTRKAAERKPAEAAAPPATEAATTETASAGGAFTASSVHLGHVFALRPRVQTSFEIGHFQQAKVLLEGESFADEAGAARAVAEKALELTHKGGSKKGKRGDRRR